MKSFSVDRNLKDKALIRLAVIKTCKNKHKKHGRKTKKYRQAQRILERVDEYTERVYQIICDTEQRNAEIRRGERAGIHPLAYTPVISGTFFCRCDNGKIRGITHAPLFPDQIIHTLLVLAAKPVFMRGMYAHSYASIPGRGIHAGKRYLAKYIKHHRNRSDIKYAAQLDIRKCYPSIRHDKLKAALGKKFRGHLFLDLCFAVIDSYHEKEKPGIGIPIGFFTSQWFCNFLLTPVDNLIKQELKVDCYLRYADDMVLFEKNKRRLHRTVKTISEAIAELGLQIKDNWQVFRFDCDGRGRDIDFLGFRFFRERTILRKRTALAIRRAAKRLRGTVTPHRACSFMSRLGALRHCGAKGFYKRYVKPFVNIKTLKGIIRNENRKLCCAG